LKSKNLVGLFHRPVLPTAPKLQKDALGEKQTQSCFTAPLFSSALHTLLAQNTTHSTTLFPFKLLNNKPIKKDQNKSVKLFGIILNRALHLHCLELV
jgi:hypothetical protein